MKILDTAIPEVKILEPRLFEDARGYFFESFNERLFAELVAPVHFVQDNESRSSYGVASTSSVARRRRPSSCASSMAVCWM